MATTVNVQIPTALRRHTGDKAQVTLEGGTVGDVLKRLAEDYPELGKRLFKPDGGLNRFVNVFVNQEDIRFLQALDTALKEGDGVLLVPAIAGGAGGAD
jgi:adenylyltransferase/sulfurtransferase